MENVNENKAPVKKSTGKKRIVEKRMSWKQIVWTGLPVFILCAILLWLAISNAHLVVDIMRDSITHEKVDFSSFNDKVASAYQSDEMNGKNDFININGLFMKAAGRETCNNVELMENGMLTEYYKTLHTDMQERANLVAGFSRFADSLGIPFAFIQMPAKMSLDKAPLLDNYVDYSNENADSMFIALRNAGVNALDLRPYVAADTAMLNEYFYRTDHHWNPKACMEVFPLIMQYLDTLLPDTKLNLEKTDPSYWTLHTVKDAFLGSRGKRTGIFYGGVDDLLYYTPEFDTFFSTTIPNHRDYREGTFEDTVLRKEYLKTTNYFSEDNYCIYYGGNYPIMYLHNYNADNDLSILVIKDSFSMPLLSFLQASFREVTVIDPRYYEECSIAEYVYMYRPDAVLECVSASVLAMDAYYNSLNGRAMLAYVQTEHNQTSVYTGEEIYINAQEGDYHYSSIPVQMEPGRQYTLHIQNVSVEVGYTECVMACLYSPSKDKNLLEIMWDVDYARENGGFTWSFVCPFTYTDDVIQLRLYPGIFGKTKGLGTRFTNIEVTMDYPVSGMKEVYSADSLVVSEQDFDYTNERLPVNLEPGKMYVISVDDIHVITGKTDLATVRLTDNAQDKAIYETLWHIDPTMRNTYKWRVIIPETYENWDDCCFELFAGEVGKTRGVSLRFMNPVVYEVTSPYGMELYFEDEREIVQENRAYNYYSLPVDLEAGKTYTLFAREITLTEGKASGLNIDLFDVSGDRSLSRSDWRINSSQTGYSWTVTVPSSQRGKATRFRVYAGWAGDTNNVGVAFRDLAVYEYPDKVRSGLVFRQEKLTIEPKNNDHNAAVLPVTLRPNHTYHVTIQSQKVNTGSAEAITVKTWSDRRSSNIDSKDWWISVDDYSFDWVFTVPDWVIKEEDLRLQICAGQNGKTAGVGVDFYGITVEEMN